MYTKTFSQSTNCIARVNRILSLHSYYSIPNKYLASLQRSCGDNAKISHTKVSVMSKFVHG